MKKSIPDGKSTECRVKRLFLPVVHSERIYLASDERPEYLAFCRTRGKTTENRVKSPLRSTPYFTPYPDSEKKTHLLLTWDAFSLSNFLILTTDSDRSRLFCPGKLFPHLFFIFFSNFKKVRKNKMLHRFFWRWYHLKIHVTVYRISILFVWFWTPGWWFVYFLLHILVDLVKFVR